MNLRRRRARTLLLLRALLYVGFTAVALLALRRLAPVLAPVGTGLFLAYLLNPLVTRLERRRIPRGAAVALLLLGCAVAATLALLFLPPLLASELRTFAERWHRYEQRVAETVLPWLRGILRLPENTSVGDTLLGALSEFGSVVRGASGDIAGAASRALATATGLLKLAIGILLTPVFTIYFLMDFPAIADGIRELVPPRLRKTVLGLVGEVNNALASWLRGQLTAMLVLAALYATGLALTGIPLGIGIGIFTGLLAFVPYVGVAIGFLFALAATLLDWHGAAPLIGVVVTFAAVQSADALFITPRIVGGRVGLSPVAVIFALSLGGELLGYAGLLLAVPAAAVSKVLFVHARRAWITSRFYTAEIEEAAEPAAEPATATPTSDDKPLPRVIEGGRS